MLPPTTREKNAPGIKPPEIEAQANPSETNSRTNCSAFWGREGQSSPVVSWLCRFVSCGRDSDTTKVGSSKVQMSDSTPLRDGRWRCRMPRQTQSERHRPLRLHT